LNYLKLFHIEYAAEDNPLFDYPDELSEDEDDGSNDEDILEMKKVLALRHCLDTPKNPKLYNIPHHIESYGTCM